MPQSLLTIPKLIAVHCLAFSMGILQCIWWSMKPRIFDFHVEVVWRSYTASFGAWHLNKNHSPLPWYINNVDYREADQSQPRRLRIAIRRIEMLWILMFVMGPYRHELCRKKGSDRIARAQKDVSIGEVHATRVSRVASRRTLWAAACQKW